MDKDYRTTTLAKLQRIFPWQQDYLVEDNQGYIQIKDQRHGFFVSVLHGTEEELIYLINQVRSWRIKKG